MGTQNGHINGTPNAPHNATNDGSEALTRLREKDNATMANKLAQHFSLGARNNKERKELREALQNLVSTFDDDQRKEVEKWLYELNMRGKRMVLAGKVQSANEVVPQRSKQDFEEYFYVRKKVIETVLEKLASDANKEAHDTEAFIHGPEGTIENIRKIEKAVFDDMKLPPPATLVKWHAALNDAKKIIDTNPDQTKPEDIKATRDRLQRIRLGLASLQLINPSSYVLEDGSIDAEAFLRNSGGGYMIDAYKKAGAILPGGRYNSEYYRKMQEQGEGQTRDPIALGGRLAGLGVFAALAVLSSIPVMRKLWHKQPLAGGDSFPLIYGAIAASLAGVSILPKGKEKEECERINAGISLYFDDAFQTAKKRMGGAEQAARAAQELSDILQDDDVKIAMLQNHLPGKENTGVSMQFIAELTETDPADKTAKPSPLYTILDQKKVTDSDRYVFLNALLQRHIDKEYMLQYIEAGIRYQKPTASSLAP